MVNKKSTSKKILVIPDAHAKPDVPNTRFSILAKATIDIKPDIIVCLGDWWDFESLSTFDVGKKSFEGRTYKADIESGLDAMDRFLSPISKTKLRPVKHFTMGNHEWRQHRAVDADRKLEGTIQSKDLQLEALGWQVHNFKEIADVEGIGFIHYVPNGLMDRPIGGKNVGASILSRWHRSLFQGHRHDLAVNTEVDADGRRLWAGSLGCYLDPNQWETYVSKTTQNTWWRGITILHNTQDGNCDPQFISLNTLIKEYGK